MNAPDIRKFTYLFCIFLEKSEESDGMPDRSEQDGGTEGA